MTASPVPAFICVACEADAGLHIGRRDGYDVFRCFDCDSTWRTAKLGHTSTERGKYQGRAYHWDYQLARGTSPFDERWDHDYEVAKMRLAVIAEIRRPMIGAMLFDVGCSNGAFVAAANDAGYRAYGMDVSGDIIQSAVQRRPDLQGRYLVGDQLPIGGLSLITYHDVLEHVADPFAVIERAAAHLLHGGMLVIESPDPQHPDAILAGAAAKHIKPVEHTMLLSERVWRKLCESAHLTVLDVRRPVEQKLAVYAVRE